MPTSKALATALLLLSLPLRAQENDTEPQVLLSMSTTWHEVVWKVHDLLPLEVDPELPDIEDGDPLLLVFTSDGKLRLTAGRKPANVLEMHAKPLPLRRLLKEEAGVVFRIFRAVCFSWFVLELHAEPRYVARAIKAVTSFPDQVETFDLTVKKRKDFPKGYTVDAVLEPRPGTWFAKVVAGTRPSRRGAHLMRTPKAAMSIAAAVEGEAVSAMIAPFGEMLASLRGRSKAERARFREFMAQRVRRFDGSFSLLVDGPGRYVRMVGLRDPVAFAKEASGEVGVAFDTRRVGRPTVRIVNALPEALGKAPVKLMEKEEDFFESVTEEEEPHKLSTFTGVVADFSLKTRLPVDGVEMARLVERVETRRLRRLPLVDGDKGKALVLAELNFGERRLRKRPDLEILNNELVKLLGADVLDDAIEALPDHVAIAVHERDGKIVIHATTR